ncbi:MAG: lipid-A-disaccharide synthase [Bacteroidaceae bacterium]|nr:lipid-A-disaccharide synthase [Bacteroidaceae bacterium]
MKYYIIAGEASGDLHASNLMRALKAKDPEAEFRFFGGDLMQAVGGTLVKHYRELAYMGFVQVALHARTILRNMRLCKEDIAAWAPNVVILVDYPGFNLSIAKYVKTHTQIPVYYYISPKIWAWKEYRIKDIRRYVDEMFSILPFEVPFYASHGYPIHYVGNPCVDAVAEFKAQYTETREEFCARHGLNPELPIVALLAGSRKQEIKDNLPVMLTATKHFKPGRIHRRERIKGFQWVIAGAPGIDKEMYGQASNAYPSKEGLFVVYGETYALLSHSYAAMVTSGTATLETALFRVPQVVCYYIMCGKVVSWLRSLVLKVEYISLVNLVANFPLVRELVAHEMRERELTEELDRLLLDDFYRNRMFDEYDKMVIAPLGEPGASEHTAEKMVELLMGTKR